MHPSAGQNQQKRSLSAWLAQKYATAITSKNSNDLIKLMELKSIPAPVVQPTLFALSEITALEEFYLALAPFVPNCYLLLVDVIISHLFAHALELQGNLKMAVCAQKRACDIFCTDLIQELGKTEERNWWLGSLNVAIERLRLLSDKADRLNHNNQFMAQVPDLLMKCFRRMIQDRRSAEFSTSRGLLFVTNHMLKVAFKVNNIRFAQNCIALVEAPNFPNLDSFPKSQVVAFLYYQSKYFIFKEQFSEAEESLERALKMCQSSLQNDVFFRNQRRILICLIPLKLKRGKFPSNLLLNRFKLGFFRRISDVVREGLLKEYETIFQQNFRFFLKHGIFAVMEKLKENVLVSVLRKIYHANSKLPDTKKAQFIRLNVIQCGIQVVNPESDVPEAEVECIIANLIHNGLIKGYLASGLGLMCSKNNPFPLR